MKNSTVLTLACLSLFVIHSPANSQMPKLPLNQRERPNVVMMSEEAKQALLVKTGGTLTIPSSGPYILFLDLQQNQPEQTMLDSVTAISRMTRLPVETRKGTGDPMKAMADELKKKEVGVVIGICEVAEHPTLLVAPESRWALINVQALKSGADAETLQTRIRKEVWRALGSLMGAGNNGLDYCVMKPVSSLADLDAIKAKTIGPESLSKILNTGAKLGIKATKSTTYRKACEEGWAPSPTNDIQKAVWAEVKKQQEKK